MNLQKARLVIFISGLFLLADRLLKWQALHSWQGNYLLTKFFGWQPFQNFGVAFSLPVPNLVIIIFSVPIIFLLLYFLVQEIKKGGSNTKMVLAWSLILFGAVSNLFDRIFYKHVIDYFLILTAVINISDIMIVVGLGLYLLSLRGENRRSNPTAL